MGDFIEQESSTLGNTGTVAVWWRSAFEALRPTTGQPLSCHIADI